MKRRIWAVLLSIIMVLSLMPVTAIAEGQSSYVVLGDSISAGYGLAVDEKSFSEQLEETFFLERIPLAASGDTSDDLYTVVSDPDNADSLKNADIITVTIGGNDMLDALYDFLAEEYNAANSPDPAWTSENIIDKITEDPIDQIFFAWALMVALPKFSESDLVQGRAQTVGANLDRALAEIKKLNPDATVIVANQYNPYLYATDHADENYKWAAEIIRDAFDDGIVLLNQELSKAAANNSCTIADVYTAFQNPEDDPCFASFAGKLNMDFHPNAYGHTLIAETIRPLIEPVAKYGLTVTGGTGSGSYRSGEKVAITASDVSDTQHFAYWEESTGTYSGNFDNPSDPNTSFTMPACPITINAVYHTWSTEWAFDDDSHWHPCSECSEKKDEEAHSYTEEVVADEYKVSDATYSAPATYYKSCVCGKAGTETFTIGSPLSPLTITGLDSSYTYGDPSFELSVQGGSGSGAVSFTSSNPDVAQVDGNTVTILKVGSFKIKATKAAGDNYPEQMTESGLVTVNPKPVTITGLSADNKVYDATTQAAISGTPSIVGKLADDDLTVEYGQANFTDKNAGDSKTVNFSGFSLSGSDAANYTLSSQPESVLADIEKRPVTLANIYVENKAYDGLNTCRLHLEDVQLVNNLDGQDLSVSVGKAVFSRVEVGDDIPVIFTGFDLSGPASSNYILESQPAGITANIYEGFLPEKNVQYFLNVPDGENSWYVSSNFTITANSGYLLSLENKDDSLWQNTLSFTDQGENCEVIFYVRNISSKEISTPVSCYYKKDSTSPAGTIQIRENEFKTFLNTITFGLFFKDKVDITISASDSLSGVAGIEYFLSDQVYENGSEIPSSGWESAAMNHHSASFSVDPADWNPDEFNETFFVYARITDFAGNICYVRSDGVVIYTDSTAADVSMKFHKDSSEDPTVSVNLNGNTIKTIFNGSYELTLNSDYTVNGSEIEFSASYLNSLEAGEYTFTVSYNPAGMDYRDLPGNSEPCTTMISVFITGHSLVKTKAEAPTCTEDGNIEYWYCNDCQKYFRDETATEEIALADTVLEATGHKPMKTDAKAPTCTEDGNIAYWYCENCDKYFRDETATDEIVLADTVLEATGHKPVKTDAKAPTCTEAGNTEYWTCEECGKIFSDSEGKTEIDIESAVIPATGHSYENGKCTVCGTIDPDFKPVIISGANSTWQKGTKDGLSFTSNATFADFQKVQVDGKDLDASNYTVKEGSTIVTLKAEYLETLSVGKHTLAIVSDTGTATTEFTIKAAAVTDDTQSPQTGDDSNVILWIALLLLSGGALCASIVNSKKKSERSR